tara:strand:+ start:563 stop:691 length:129 start_codon:yes stop_codon:yes gene_type:complete
MHYKTLAVVVEEVVRAPSQEVEVLVDPVSFSSHTILDKYLKT